MVKLILLLIIVAGRWIMNRNIYLVSVFYRFNVMSTARYMEVLQPINASVSSSVRHRLVLPGVWCWMKQELIDKSIGRRVEISLYTEQKKPMNIYRDGYDSESLNGRLSPCIRFSQCILNELLVFSFVTLFGWH